MKASMWAFVVPLIVFVVVVGPIWVVFYYITVWKRMKAERPQMSADDDARFREAVSSLKRRAEGLENRVETLERLLDAEVAEWRNRI
ncbi:MAG: envelope stress response membrane protein PspB [Pseudomonadota bacterium]